MREARDLSLDRDPAVARVGSSVPTTMPRMELRVGVGPGVDEPRGLRSRTVTRLVQRDRRGANHNELRVEVA